MKAGSMNFTDVLKTTPLIGTHLSDLVLHRLMAIRRLFLPLVPVTPPSFARVRCVWCTQRRATASALARCAQVDTPYRVGGLGP